MTDTMVNSGPGYAKHPEHEINVRPFAGRVTVRLDDLLMADTTQALEMCEGRYPAVYYLPDDAMPAGLFLASPTTTYCPFKGTATYRSLSTPDGVVQDIAWSYATPYREVAMIAGYWAFYANKVIITATALV